jgi:ribosomal protein S27AE
MLTKTNKSLKTIGDKGVVYKKHPVSNLMQCVRCGKNITHANHQDHVTCDKSSLDKQILSVLI